MTLVPAEHEIRDDIRDEAERLGERVLASGVPIRLMGGLAVWLACPSVRRPPYVRSYGDLDFAAASTDRPRVAAFFEQVGYVPEKMFNALHGARRLNFRHPAGRWTIDVLYDELHMSHHLDLRGRLNAPVPTVALADLLLMKLQIWEINQKDLGDIVCLLADHALAASEAADAIDSARVISLVATDWGLCHTVERNLRRARDLAADRAPTGAPHDPVDQCGRLLAAIEAAPKSVGWRARARVGERHEP